VAERWVLFVHACCWEGVSTHHVGCVLLLSDGGCEAFEAASDPGGVGAAPGRQFSEPGALQPAQAGLAWPLVATSAGCRASVGFWLSLYIVAFVLYPLLYCIPCYYFSCCTPQGDPIVYMTICRASCRQPDGGIAKHLAGTTHKNGPLVGLQSAPSSIVHIHAVSSAEAVVC
jgi:hypothetical protein